MRSLASCAVLLCVVSQGACSSDSSGSDAGPKPDGPGRDGSVTDTGNTKDTTSDTGTKDSAGADSAPAFVEETTLANDDGMPALKLAAAPSSEGYELFAPDPSLFPMQVRQIKFIPATAFSGSISVSADQFGSPGTALVTKQFTVAAGDVDKWFTIDLGNDKVVVDGKLWTTMKFAATLAEQQKTIYGTSSTSGRNKYFNPGYPIYTTNFDQMLRVVVGLTKAPPAPGADGAACTAGLDCDSGYCSAGKCTVSCTDSCTNGRVCHPFLLDKVCVTPCTNNAGCPAGAFCLTDETLIQPAGFCIRGGPYATGDDCQYHYHTICAEGHCSACDADPMMCDQPGTCQSKP